MNLIATIVIGGLIAGFALGVALLFFASPDVRARAEGGLLRFGSGGTLFMVVWWLVSSGRAQPEVEIAIGLIAFTPLVAGLVLSIGRRMRAGA